MPVQFSEYHGVSTAEHQNQITSLTAQGYRMISVSVFGNPADVRYAAVWVKRTGPTWQEVHGLDGAAYQTAFNQWTSQGYAPVLISATGTAANAIYTAVFEQGTNALGWMARHGMISGADSNPNTFEYYCKYAQNSGYILLCSSLYGDATQRLYAAIWVKRADPVLWTSRPNDGATEHQAFYDAVTQIPFRLSHISPSADQRYTTAYRNDTVGEWSARTELTGDDFASALASLSPQGFYPIVLQGSGTGSAARYSTIFAKQDVPSPRLWNMTGKLVAPLIPFDSAMKNHMKAEGIRCGQIAIAKNGVLKLARAYTWAEPGFPLTQPTNLFRLASVSKMLTAAAIKNLYDTSAVQPTDAVFPLLGITTPAIPGSAPDPRINSITVQHLVDHLGGWVRNQTSDASVSPTPFDPVFTMRGIALRLGLPGALTKLDLARYMYGMPLQFTPGTPQTGVDTYSNFGYVLLGMVVERITGQSFIDYVKQAVLAPLAITDVDVSKTLKADRAATEVTYEDPGLGLSAADPQSSLLTPCAYGGQGWKSEVMDSAGGLMGTATDLVTLAHSYAVWASAGAPREPHGRNGRHREPRVLAPRRHRLRVHLQSQSRRAGRGRRSQSDARPALRHHPIN